MLDQAAEAEQQGGAEANGQALRQGQDGRVHPVSAAVGVEHGGHGGPQDAAGVVEHVGDGKGQGGRGEVAPPGCSEDAGRRERELSAAVRLPKAEEDEEEEADDEGCYDVSVGGLVEACPHDAGEYWNTSGGEEQDTCRLVYLSARPVTHYSRRLLTEIVDLLDGLKKW